MLLLWILLLILSFASSKAVEYDYNFNSNEKSEVGYIESKCLQNANADTFAILQETSEEFGACLNISVIHTKDHLFSFICSHLPQTGYKCLNGLMEKLRPCLDTEALFLVDFVLNTFNNTINHRCKGGADIFVDRLLSIENETCNAEVPLLSLLLTITDQCVPKYLLMRDNVAPNSNFILTQTYFCDEMRSFQYCTFNLLNGYCNNEAISRYLVELLEPALNWCAESLSVLEVESNISWQHVTVAIEKFISRKCLKNAGANTLRRMQHLMDVSSKINDTVFVLTELQYSLICTFFPAATLDVIKELSLCLEDEEIFLTDLILEAVSDYVKHQCGNGKKAFIVYMDKINNLKCGLKEFSFDFLYESCAPKMFIFQNKNVDLNFVLTKNQFCSEVKILTDCFIQTTTAYCTNDATEYVRAIAKSVLKQCS